MGTEEKGDGGEQAWGQNAAGGTGTPTHSRRTGGARAAWHSKLLHPVSDELHPLSGFRAAC